MSKKMIKQYKKITISACLLLGFQTGAWAQAGINTKSPKSTFDITAVNQTSHIAGFIAPRIALADLTAKGNTLYGADQKGTIVYITAVTGGGNTGQRVNITSIGYYYFDGTVWLKFGVKQDARVAGNIKESFKAADHKGWYLLDGRTVASLPSKARAVAVSLGFAANLPDARDRVLKSKTGTEVLGAVGGSNTVTLTLANLPKLNLAGTFSGTGASGGAHTHALSATSTNTSHLHSFSTTSSSDAHAHTYSLASVSNAHSHSFSATSTTNGAHAHTYVMPTRQNSSFLGTLSGLYNMTAAVTSNTWSGGAHTHTFSGTSASGGAVHTHTASGTAANGGAAHTHTGSGTTSSGGAAHAHAFSGTSASGGAVHTHAVSGTANSTLGTVTAPIPGFRLEDGNQGEGNILISTDNIGTATWKNMTPAISAQIIIVAPPYLNIGLNDTQYHVSPSYIDLPAGRWAMNVVSLISGNGGPNTPVWISSTLADATTAANSGGTLAAVRTPDIEGLGLVSGMCWAHYYNVIIGSFIVNNQTNATKRYYYVAGGTSSFDVTIHAGHFEMIGGPWGEINMIAYRIPSDEL